MNKKKKIRQTVESAARSIETEGLPVSGKQKKLCRKLLSEEITYEEYMIKTQKEITKRRRYK